MSTDRDRGASSPQLMRHANRQALMQHALRTEAFTAADAMAATGLTRATVLGVCAELEQAGWLLEVSGGRDESIVQRGRPARHFSLRADAAVLIGVDAGQHTLAARVADLRGRELAAARRTIDGTLDHAPGGEQAGDAGARADGAAGDGTGEGSAGRVRIQAVRELIDQVLEQAGAQGRHRLLTVVGVPAPVDFSGHSPRGDLGYWPAMNPGFVDALDSRILVENDANLAVIAEQALGDAPEGPTASHLAALLMGERFGAGLIVDGHLLRGADGGAGEMRFLDGVLGDSRGADGVAALARRWTLDALAAGGASAVLTKIPHGELSAIDVFAAAREGDLLAQGVLDRIGDRLARIAAILSSLLGIETVAVAGAIAEAIGPVLEHSDRVLRQISTPPYPTLRASTLGKDVVVCGAIELALTRLRADPLDLLSTARPAG